MSQLMEHHTDAGSQLVLDVVPSCYLNSTQTSSFHSWARHAFVIASDVFHSQSKTQLATFMKYKLITNIASLSLTVY